MFLEVSRLFLFIPWLLCFVISVFGVESGTASNQRAYESEVKVLRVGVPLLNEAIPLESGKIIYAIESVAPRRSYEVKVSYPSSIPARFQLSLVNLSYENVASDYFPIFRRKLLDVEKLSFSHDCDTLYERVQVMVTVQPGSVLGIKNVIHPIFVVYNIECEELFFEIPVSALKVIVIGLVGLAAILFCVSQPFKAFERVLSIVGVKSNPIQRKSC